MVIEKKENLTIKDIHKQLEKLNRKDRIKYLKRVIGQKNAFPTEIGNMVYDLLISSYEKAGKFDSAAYVAKEGALQEELGGNRERANKLAVKASENYERAKDFGLAGYWASRSGDKKRASEFYDKAELQRALEHAREHANEGGFFYAAEIAAGVGARKESLEYARKAKKAGQKPEMVIEYILNLLGRAKSAKSEIKGYHI